MSDLFARLREVRETKERKKKKDREEEEEDTEEDANHDREDPSPSPRPPFLRICAPMVRYSKLPFRTLVRHYATDLAFTPMMLADSFARSAVARDVEFSTDDRRDDPLIAQFAANNADDFVAAAQLVQNDVDGVDLNCGCPQRWALKEGLGASLIDRPEMVSDLVRQTRNRCRNDLAISVKIRIHDNDIKRTVEFCRRMEMSGADFVTVHGRTKEQRCEPVDLDAVRDVKLGMAIPVVLNGDVTSLAGAEAAIARTGADGVMAARGMLENPAMFAGHAVTPPECVRKWVEVALETGVTFSTFHHHLMYMCEKVLPRHERRVFNGLGSVAAVVDFLEDTCLLYHE